MRVKRLGSTEPLSGKVILGMVMDGTMPTFYKISITPELVRAVESGEQPEQETVIHAYLPDRGTKTRGRYETVGQPLRYIYIKWVQCLNMLDSRRSQTRIVSTHHHRPFCHVEERVSLPNCMLLLLSGPGVTLVDNGPILTITIITSGLKNHNSKKHLKE